MSNVDESQKHYWTKKARQKRIHTELFYVCEVQEQEKLICSKRYQNNRNWLKEPLMITGGGGERVTEVYKLSNLTGLYN